MPAFFSPLAGANTWTLTVAEEVTIPYEVVTATTPSETKAATGFRYAGHTFRGLAAARAAAAEVFFPALGFIRRTDGEAAAFVEIQLNPFPVRGLVAQLPWGVPTFYLFFPDKNDLTTFETGQTAPGGELLATTGDLTIVCVGQDRLSLDPALWAQQITTAVNNVGGDSSTWTPFADAVAAATNSGPSAPVLLLDHRGLPQTGGDVDIIIGAVTHHATLAPEDRGDLQKTVARMNAADPAAMPIANLWGGGVTEFDLRPLPAAPAEAIQLVRYEDRLTASGQIQVTQQFRHVSYTNLHDWFADQFAVPADPADPRLARFTRGNRVTPLVNGPEFFNELFPRLLGADAAGRGLHLAGWSMFHDVELVSPNLQGAPPGLPLTLREAAEHIGEGGGACRFLVTDFVQFEPGESVRAAEAMIFYFIMAGIHVLNGLGVSFARTDAAGAFILLALWVGSILYTDYFIDSSGAPVELNQPAVEALDDVPNSQIRFSPYPATVDDNPAAAVGEFPFTTIFETIRRFGVHHHKLSVLNTSAGIVAYCGGVDLNPDRLDTADHTSPKPYHDVHARVEGPAVRDLALSFEQRWLHDAGIAPPAPEGALAFQTPAADSPALVVAGGADAVQVARTYFNPADPARRFRFAPNGDRTIRDTMLQAIDSAREFIYIEEQYFTPPPEYADALVAKVESMAASGGAGHVIIALPGLTDQPFGEIERNPLIARLRAADPHADDPARRIVRVGYPRRHPTVPDNEVRSSSGKCILLEDLPAGAGVNPTVVLGPLERLPAPPFWVAVEGELLWAYSVSADPPPDPQQGRRFNVERGDATRLVRGGAAPKGASARAHEAGAAATVLELANIYVHAKLTIVDDAFLCVGSANLNRRGLLHDGEINIFTVPQALKAGPNNPVAALRARLWAEMLNLPERAAAPLMRDPHAAALLFDRSPFGGNRFVPVDAVPAHLMFDITTGDSIITNIIIAALGTVVVVEHDKLFASVVDPSN